MTTAGDYIIAAIAAGWLLWSVYHIRKRRRNGGCVGCGGKCAGCGKNRVESGEKYVECLENKNSQKVPEL